MTRSIITSAVVVALVSLTAACSKPAPVEPAQSAAATPEPAAPEAPAAPVAPASEMPASETPAAATDAAAFVGKVWQVKASSSVAPGTRYSFLADGTLVIEAEGGTPGYGKWTYENGALTMIEEGISYPTDILKLDATTFEIRSHNPGEPVTITLVPADNAPLPPATP